MSKILVWDFPIRLLHWAFAGCLAASIGLAFLADDHSGLFQVHMLLGVVALFLLAIRVLLGFAGSRYARFASFPLRPGEVFGYVGSAIAGLTKRYPGNNPGSAVAAVLMFLLVPALFVTGAGWGGDAIEEAHGALAWLLLAVITLHPAGIALHTLRHRENIAAAMLSGTKEGDPADAISSPQRWFGALLLLAGGAWIVALFGSHDAKAAKVRLPLAGTVINLGAERGEQHEPTRKHHGKEQRHDDDD